MKRNPWIRTIVCAVLAAVVFVLCHAAQGHTQAVERIYSQGIYKVWAQVTSTVTGLLPVSLSELALLVLLPVGLVASIVRWAKRRIGWQRFVSGWLAMALGAYALFYGGWGLNYSRQPYASIAGLETAPVEVDKVEELTRSLAAQANELRAQLDAGDEAYALTCPRRDVLKKVNEAYAAASARYPWLSGHYGAPKFALLSTPLAHLNIAGIFSPFTMEAHVNAHEADVLLAATAMHEAAHLRGFAREDEANYIAYAVCMESDDPYVRYSGTILGLIYAGNALNGSDPDAYRAVWDTYSPGVVSDLRAYSAAWAPYKGKASEVGDKMNDAYLKANNQTDGVKSYGRMVDLMIAQMRKDRGE